MNQLNEYLRHLHQHEKSELTIEKYCRDAAAFLAWLDGRPLNKEETLAYKAEIMTRYAVSSVNSMISALNSYLEFIGRHDCRVRAVKRQRDVYLPKEKELTRGEYQRLVRAAAGDERFCLLLQALCSTGIRVSEHRFITVEAAKRGVARVCNKGKCRTILLPGKLCRALLAYAKRRGITAGSVFVTRTGRPLDRSRIWADMKKLCHTARVSAEKVFPHNLRHLFARTYYAMEKDIARLADLLGHSSINTTRIYTMESGETHRRQLERLPLLCIT